MEGDQLLYTLTPNPAIDLYIGMDQLLPNTVNRTNEEDYQANGKAVNISVMLQRFGLPNTALGFIGGFSGRFIEEELQKQGIQTNFVRVEGTTRINVFVNADKEYKIVNQGPEIPKDKLNEMKKLLKELPEQSTLFLSGSLPKGLDDKFYLETAKICKDRKIKLILDISSPILLDCLAYQPYLIKPNDDELASFFNIDTEELTDSKIIFYANKLVQLGAQHVLVSRGEKGAIYVTDSDAIKVTAPKGEVVNTACAGDSLLATFASQEIKGESIEQALVLASAVGSSTAFSKGLSDLSDINALIKQISIHSLKEELNNVKG
ncbi:1-phosphofructokinase [Paraliobacillus salinarum]|uniref:1-phosphofructokinase n=1 Tax=Paraliobacillus salinarum TaxID=1158996 RepID=UPI001FE59A35|nr:1-phosphofructokinase [Paraliobacillus salinarum]